MFILPADYEKIYSCINTSGATSKIYANLNYTEAYKIYLKKFNYQEEKMNKLIFFKNPNVIAPTDIINIQNNNEIVGYKMNYEEGKSLSKLLDADISLLIKASLDIPNTLKDISHHNFLITDPNIDNIVFSKEFKFVDVYSFLWAQKFSEDVILQKNLKKTNISVLSGLLGFSYQLDIANYLKNQHSKYLEKILNLNSDAENYIYLYLSLLQETMKEDSLKLVRQKIC